VSRQLAVAVRAGARSRPGHALVSACGPAPVSATGSHRPERWLRLGLVGLCFGLLAVSAALGPVAPGGASGLTLAGHRLPELCTLKATTGVPCPGCGLTRSWVSAVHGDAAGSLGHHPLGWLVLLYALAQGARHAAWLTRPGRRPAIERLGGRFDRGIVLLGALLFGAWIPTLVRALAERL
jgi:hypothetical protein